MVISALLFVSLHATSYIGIIPYDDSPHRRSSISRTKAKTDIVPDFISLSFQSVLYCFCAFIISYACTMRHSFCCDSVTIQIQIQIQTQ